ncbi:MAG: SEC-C metal-binding domain-containing protein, partial [Anaeromyxobacteraceae bacterium]
LCDFGTEQRVELEVVGFGDPANVPQRPRVIAREGELPAREKDEDEAEDEEDEEAAVERGPGDVTPVLALAPAGELEAALAAWDHDAADDGSRFALDPSRVAAALAAVLDACPSPRDLALLGQAHGVRLDAFVLAALRAVASRGDPDVALREARRFAAMVRMTVPLLATATAFAHAGRAAPAREALAAAEAFDAPFPQSARFAAAEIRTALGDFAGAEADLRQLVSRRWGSPRIRPAAAGALAHRLRESGRDDEAEAIALAERHRVERDAGVVRREAPRVGRNDPCPCGSGKKSKKCCGA